MDATTESRLKALVDANRGEGARAYAERWKASGGRVAAVLCSYVPREILYAGGFLPFSVHGSLVEATLNALVYRPAWSSPRNTHILESVLAGELDFVDGVVGTDWDVDTKRLWDQWTAVRKADLAHIMFVPRLDSAIHVQRMRESVAKLRLAVENCVGRPIPDADVREAVLLYRRQRDLVRRLYELRKRERPAVTGSEALGITTAALVMPPAQFNAALEELLPALEAREAATAPRPRLLVSSDFLDDVRYLESIEAVGCVVAMDDLDTGSRYFYSNIEEGECDPMLALAKGYLLRPGCPRMVDWEKQTDQVVRWSREYKVDGVLELRLNNSMIRHLRTPILQSTLDAAGIPFYSVAREHNLANEAQLRTRVGAFIEMLETGRCELDSTITCT